MKQLKKTWKVITYFAVLFALVILDLELIAQFYTAAGLGWLVIYILRNSDPGHNSKVIMTADDLDSQYLLGVNYRR